MNPLGDSRTFVSYYGPDPRLDTAYLIPKIRQPTLVVLAGDDEVVVNDKKFAPLADGMRVQIKVIAAAGHFFGILTPTTRSMRSVRS